jgi:hypothetical protein
LGERRLRKPAYSLTTNNAQNACPKLPPQYLAEARGEPVPSRGRSHRPSMASRSLGELLASPSWLRSDFYAARLARAPPSRACYPRASSSWKRVQAPRFARSQSPLEALRREPAGRRGVGREASPEARVIVHHQQRPKGVPNQKPRGAFRDSRRDGGPLGERRSRKPETFLATPGPEFDFPRESLLGFTGRGDRLTRSPFPAGMTGPAERRGRQAEAGLDQQK